MNEHDEARRGEDARRVLGEAIYKEAYVALEARWVNELAQQELDPKRAEYLRALLVAGRKHKQYMEQVMVSGNMATIEIERKRTLRERFLRRA